MRWFVVFFVLLMAVPAQAFEFGEEGEDMSFYGMPLPAAKPGNLAWQTIGSTKETEALVNLPEWGDTYVITPTFNGDLKALDGKIVTLSGFMFPLEQTESQANFLFGPFPPSCPYHYDLPMSLIVEVKAKAPVEFSWDEISLRGTLVLAEKDPNGIFYFLQNAEIITN